MNSGVEEAAVGVYVHRHLVAGFERLGTLLVPDPQVTDHAVDRLHVVNGERRRRPSLAGGDDASRV